jgi:DNA-binding MarR family transcriptional regulator
MISSIDQDLAHSLRDMVSRLSRGLRKQVSNPEQLSVAEENIVRVLISQQEALPSELCARLKISSQFMSQLLNRLQRLNYISRKVSRTDKRKSRVSLSKKGLDKIQQRRQQKEDWLASMISRNYNKQQKGLLAKAAHLISLLHEDR